MARMSLRNQITVSTSVTINAANATGVAPTRNCAKVNPALLPMKMPTGLPSMVADDPILVAITAISTKGCGRSLRVSQTWKTSASTTTMELTSSTTDASTADSTHRMSEKLTPFIFRRLMMVWMTQVRKPRSLSTPTMIIMPTRKKMISSSVALRMVWSVMAWQAIRIATPMNAAATRRSQKKSVVEITPAKTASVICWVGLTARPAIRPPKETASTIAANSKSLGLNLIMMDYSRKILLRKLLMRISPTSLLPSRT